MHSELWHSVTVCVPWQLISVMCLGTAKYAVICDMKLICRVVDVVPVGCALPANFPSAYRVRSFSFVPMHRLSDVLVPQNVAQRNMLRTA